MSDPKLTKEQREALAESLRARIEAAVSTWPPGPREGDVYRALDGGA